MPTFECPNCQNARRWRNLSTGPDGTQADCKGCGTRVVRLDVTTPYTVNLADTDNTQIGGGKVQRNIF